MLKRSLSMSISCSRQSLVIVLTTCLIGTAAITRAADDGNRERIFENTYVTVDRITLAPGEGLARHPGPDRIVYSLSDYTIAWTEAGDTASKTWRSGDVHAHEALDHAVENIGETTARFVLFAFE
jgi:hypothetical protein